MKISLGTIIRIWLLLLISIQANIFYDLGFDTGRIDLFCLFSPFLLFIICFNNESIHKYLKDIDKFFKKFVLLYFAFFIVEVIYTFFEYRNVDISFYYIIRLNIYLLDILLAYPLIYLYRIDGGMTKMLKWFLFLAIFGNVIRTLSYFSYSLTGVRVFPNVVAVFENSFRNSRNRLGATLLHTLGFNISLAGFAFSKKGLKRTFLLLCIILFVSYQFYISQGRSQNACYAITILFFIYYVYSERITKKKNRVAIRALFIVSIAILTLYAIDSDSLGNYIGSFLDLSRNTNEMAASSISRTYAIGYYWGRIKDNPFLGLGFLYNDNGLIASILRGNGSGYAQVAYTEDLGILGQFFNYGILGVSFFVVLFIRWYCIMKKSNKLENKKYFALLLPMFIHGLTQTLTSMSLFQRNKFIYVPIYISIFEYVALLIKQNELIKRQEIK